jgi:AraC-like DNA-binding protein/mannose-6-phosphate isomerase-like protein (cupin superfamily)
MSYGQRKDFLRRFPVCRTTDKAVFENTLLNVAGATGFLLPDPVNFEARLNRAQLRHMSLGFSNFSSRLSIRYAESHDVRHHFVLAGASSMTVDETFISAREGQSYIVPAGRPTTIDYLGNTRQLILRIETAALVRALAAVLGSRPKGALDFDAAPNQDDQNLRDLRTLTILLAEQLDSSPAQPPTLIIREMEKAVISAFLYANRHSFSHLLDRDAGSGAPAHVRRTEEFIEANWDRVIDLDELVELTGVSTRTLSRAFRAHRGYSPREFAKQVRLKQAKRMLGELNPGTSVTGVAFACGFGNLGHFAREYREAFGELPSETLEGTLRTSA